MAEGWTIGSHGVTHRKFSELDGPAMQKEAAGSRAALESALGCEVSWFAYPYGTYNAAAKQSLSRAGYKIGFATEEGDGDILAVPRRIISGRSGLLRFFSRLGQARRLGKI